jgi:hypothetical protein
MELRRYLESTETAAGEGQVSDPSLLIRDRPAPHASLRLMKPA